MKLTDYEHIDCNIDQDPYFTWRGCDNTDCEAHNLGCDVYDCRGWLTRQDLINDMDGNCHEFILCFDCVYEYEYGERPEL